MDAQAQAPSHDQNFKMLIVENTRDAITFALPKCETFFQREPEIEFIREETIKAFFADSFFRMDVPVLAKYEQAAFVFLLEHQHDPYAFSIHHLARCVSHLEEQYGRDVIPIVYFPNVSAKNKTLPREIKSAFFGKRYHYFTYQPVLLRGMPAKKYLNSKNVFARLMLPFMQYSQADWLKIVDSALQSVIELVEPGKRVRQGKYLDFLMHYFNLSAEKWNEYRSYKQRQKESEAKEMSEIISDILKRQGWQEGWEKGMEKGIEKGIETGLVSGLERGKLAEARNLLMLLLPKKLGPIPPALEMPLREVDDIEFINDLLARVLEIRDWSEVERLLQ